MINNNYNRSVNFFGMVEDMELDMLGCSLNTYMHQYVCRPVCLSLQYSFIIFDAIFYLLPLPLNSQYHISFIQIQNKQL